MEPDLAVKRIKDFVTRYKIKGLRINDSNFFINKERARRILREIINENLGIVLSKINIDSYTLLKLEAEDLALLEQAGCRRIPVAIESGSERMRTLLKKPLDVERLLEFNANIKRYAMYPNYVFMMGLPTETKDDIAKSISLVFKLIEENPQAGISNVSKIGYPFITANSRKMGPGYRRKCAKLYRCSIFALFLLAKEH
jgi:radical SAM superfamily enzyme YgiQ (UPF0313 family)